MKHLASYCTALGDLHIYTKHILAYEHYYYISERHTKISERLYIKVCKLNKFIIKSKATGTG